MNIQTVILEDKEYYVLEKISIKENIYYILSNVENNKDICIRRYEKDGDGTFLVGLQDENEFNEVMQEYSKKWETV